MDFCGGGSILLSAVTGKVSFKKCNKIIYLFYGLLRSEIHVDEQIRDLTTLEKSVQSKSKTELHFGLFTSEVFSDI